MLWIFGYGSIIWRPGFEHLRSLHAALPGYERRFCQASHDHRGTLELPGRVVTLVPVRGGSCQGMAFELPPVGRTQILSYLDEREQDGYERVYAPLQLSDGVIVPGLTWIAAADNPSWREGESLDELALLISKRQGPSGSNRDYLFNLEEILKTHDMPDAYISVLAGRVRSLIEKR
ncbi:gamma-glutamylcyclotransferase [Granulosicoccus antarcticus]|uniref:gamma-glutamylcyclotransferase n=1 Tax=Granulosicoccus antarcticus TaxID=437505 RepID=UPI0012FE5CDD|nr:gamma-glutamylcyclotransferase [Granulosicoccus antarcticus]